MRRVAIVVAILVAAQFAFHELLYRNSTRNVLIDTYRAPAIQSCARDARKQRLAVAAEAWQKPSSIKLVIGKDDLDVYFWQVDNPMWKARYTNPYLFIVAEKPSGYVLCEYDIIHRTASVQRM